MTRRPRSPVAAFPTWRAHLPASVAFFDVETTGLAGSDRIVTFAGIGLKTEALANEEFDIEYLYLAFNPERRSHPRAEQVHGYTDSLLRFQDPFSVHAEDIREFLSSYDLLVAHNAVFDFGFVSRELALAGLEPISRPIYCTMEGYRALGLGGSASLDAVCNGIDLARKGRLHGALEDAWLAMRVYLWLNNCPLEADMPPTLPREPTNLRETPKLPEPASRREPPEEIRVPQPTRRVRPPVPVQKSMSGPTMPVLQDIKTGSEDTKKPPEEIRAPQQTVPTRPIVSLSENPKPPSPQPSPTHTYPAPLEDKIGGLSSVVWTSALFLFFAGMPVFLILTYALNHDLPPLMALPKLIAALLLNFSAFAGANLAQTPVYSKSTVSHQIGWVLTLVAVPATFVAIYLFIHNSGWAYGLMLWFASGGLSSVLLTALRKGLGVEGLGTLFGIVAGIVGFVLFFHAM